MLSELGWRSLEDPRIDTQLIMIMKGLTSWLSSVVSNCEFVTFPLVSWVRCGTWLYRFLNFAPLLTYKIVHGYAATKLQTYLDKSLRHTCRMHHLSFRQINIAASYYQYSFYPVSGVLWNRLPSEVVFLEKLGPFRKEVCKINNQVP